MEAIEFLKRMYDLGRPPGIDSPTGSASAAFASQQTAISRGNSSTYSNLLQQAPHLVPQLGAFAPRRSPDHQPVSLAFVDGIGIASGSHNPDLAWAFITKLTSLESAKAFVELRGFVSPRVDILDWIQDEHSAFLPWFLATNYLVPWPQVPTGGYSSIGRWLGQAFAGEISPKEALDQAEATQRALFDEWWAQVESRQ